MPLFKSGTSCPDKERGRVVVEVRRIDVSKKSGTIGKNQNGLTIKLFENDIEIASTTSKKYIHHSRFDFRIKSNSTYTVQLIGNDTWTVVTGNTGGNNDGTQQVGVFPVNLTNVATVGTNNRRVVNLAFEIDRAVKRYKFQQKLRMPTPEELETHFFPDDVGTKKGQRQRLQLMGFYNRPLDYDFSKRANLYSNNLSDFATDARQVITENIIDKYTEDQCLVTAIKYYKIMHKLNNDADIRLTLNQHVLEFWMQQSKVKKGVLPQEGEFARLLFPGGYNVLWPKGSREHAANLFGMGGSDRYDVELAFKKANPLLGKIPFVVDVEAQEGASGNWVPLASIPDRGYTEVDLKVSLVKAVAPTNSSFVQSHQPEGEDNTYLNTRVDSYVAEFQNDPLKGNVHWHLGGKRAMKEDGNFHQNASCSKGERKAQLPFRYTSLGSDFVQPESLLANEEVPFKQSLHIKVPRDGKAFVVFDSSTVGGDQYCIQSEIGPATLSLYGNETKHTIKSGTLVVWRNVRVLHQIRAQQPRGLSDLDPTLKEDLKVGEWTCDHNPHLSGRICLECLQRENGKGGYKWMDFSKDAAKEFAKAYCELELAPKLAEGEFEKMSDNYIKSALEKALDIVQGNKDVNYWDGARCSPIEFILADGKSKEFGKRKVATSFRKGSVKLMYLKPEQRGKHEWEFMALNNSTTNTCAPPPKVDAKQFSYDAKTKKIKIVFANKIDKNWSLIITTEDKLNATIKIPLDCTAVKEDGKTIEQTLEKDLYPQFDVKLEGMLVAQGLGERYDRSENEFYITSLLTVTGVLANAQGIIREGKRNYIILKIDKSLTVGDELKLYGNGSDSSNGGWVNGQTIADHTTKVDWIEIDIDGKMHSENAEIRLREEVVAIIKKDGIFVRQGRFDTRNKENKETPPVALNWRTKAFHGKPSQIEFTFGTALDTKKNFVLHGGGTSNDDFLEEFVFEVDKNTRKTTVDLPANCVFRKAVLRENSSIICDSSYKIKSVEVSAVDLALTKGDVDNDKGTVHLEFNRNLPAGARLGLVFICDENFVQLRKLFYHPQAGKDSPFLLNLHPAWTYNVVKDSDFGPLSAVGVSGEVLQSKSTAKKQELRFAKDLVTQCLRIDVDGEMYWRAINSVAGNSKFTVKESVKPKVDSTYVFQGGTRTELPFKKDFKAEPKFKIRYKYHNTPNLLRVKWGEFQGGDGPLTMEGDMIKQVLGMLPSILTEFFRQIHENQSFIPGLIFMQAPFYDTWGCTYWGGAQVGLAQGPGSFLTGSKMFDDENTYLNHEESGDTNQGGSVEKIGTHEIAHSLFYQHAGSAGGAKPNEHSKDDCIMSYSNNMKTFCGQCLAGLRGMNFKDERFQIKSEIGADIVYKGSQYWQGQSVKK